MVTSSAVPLGFYANALLLRLMSNIWFVDGGMEEEPEVCEENIVIFCSLRYEKTKEILREFRRFLNEQQASKELKPKLLNPFYSKQSKLKPRLVVV